MLASAPVSHMTIKIDGAPAPADLPIDLLEVVVDHSLHLPSMFTIRLNNRDVKWIENGTFREGKKVEILAGEPSPVKLLSGKIAGLEAELEQGQPELVVRGYDLAHRLYRGRHRRAFIQVKDSDIATTLAGEAGLRPGTIDSTAEIHDYIFQNNQTNAEFLLERARWHGFELYVEDDALHFRKPSASGSPIRLVWGDDLLSFHPHMSTTEQVNEVEVRGWDPIKKEKVEAHVTSGLGAPRVGMSPGGTGANLAKETWGEAKYAIVDQFVRSNSEAQTVAQAAMDEMTSVFIEARGVCQMNPDIVPGRQVQIENVGTRFNGTYYVTEVTHEWRVNTGMTSQFTVSGHRDRGVWSLLQDTKPYTLGMGMVIGIVTNNKSDPLNMGRIKVKYPWLSDNDESAWARIVTPMAGPNRGFQYVPEIDDEVLVGFEHGDINRPFILGALWNGKDKTPLTADQAVGSDGKVNKRIVKSRSGHTVVLDDTDGNEEITIIDKTGDNKIVIHSPDNSMQIKVKGDLTIEAQGKITLKGQTGVDLSSAAKLTVDGQTGVEVTTNASLSMKGTSGATLEGTASLTVKNGTGAQIAMTGPTVNVNNGALEVM
ncbi:MAG: VgrG-related protein [Anaerolineae bacterium]